MTEGLRYGKMKFEDIISWSIKKGWKKENMCDMEKLEGKDSKIFLSKNGYMTLFYGDAIMPMLEINLEEIEEIKQLCRVLWGVDRWTGDRNYFVAYSHFNELTMLNSWKERKEYIIKNFNQDE